MSELTLDLASQSPRRKALLAQIGVNCQVLPDMKVDESPLVNEAAQDYVIRIAHNKALAGKSIQTRSCPVLAADTSVFIDSSILGKPRDLAHAQSILKRLSDKTHQVTTAVCILHHDQVLIATSVSEVTFSPLSDAQILDYCQTNEPYDKAGAYAIQGLAARFIKHITGSYSGIMGLPLFETYALLQKLQSVD